MFGVEGSLFFVRISSYKEIAADVAVQNGIAKSSLVPHALYTGRFFRFFKTFLTRRSFRSRMHALIGGHIAQLPLTSVRQM